MNLGVIDCSGELNVIGGSGETNQTDMSVHTFGKEIVVGGFGNNSMNASSCGSCPTVSIGKILNIFKLFK